MASRDEPSDPREALAAAEAAHLAARRTGGTPRAGARSEAESGARDRHQHGGGGHGYDRRGDEGFREDRPGAETRRGRRPAAVDRQRAGRRRPPVALAAVVAATTAAAVSFAPVAAIVTLLRLADGGEAALAAPARLAAAAWLLAHGVPLQAGPGQVGLLPLALSLLAAWRVARAGVHVTRAIGARHTGSWRRALIASGATGLAYGFIGLAVAAIAAGPGWWAEPLRAGATLAGFGFLAASYGSLRTTGVLARLVDRTPDVIRDGLRAGGVAGLLVLAAGAATAGIGIAVAGAAAADTLAAYGTGVAGQAGLTLVCLAYAPNLAVWAAAYLVGPGFLVGTGTVVRSSEVIVGPLPALPVFAGLPDGPLPSVGAALLAVPTVAGLVAGWLLVRHHRRDRRGNQRTSWRGLLGASLLAGPVAGGLVGAAAAASGGPLGTGHLAVLGPVAWQVAALAAALVTPGALLGAGLAGLTIARRD
jgi:hypothetical protein